MNNHSGEVYGLWTITDKDPVRVNKTTLFIWMSMFKVPQLFFIEAV